MPKPHSLKMIAAELGESLDVLIPRAIQEEGSILRASIRLGVTPNSLQQWLKKNSYNVETKQVAVVTKGNPNAAAG